MPSVVVGLKPLGDEATTVFLCGRVRLCEEGSSILCCRHMLPKACHLSRIIADWLHLIDNYNSVIIHHYHIFLT